MAKKILSFLLVLAFMIFLVACKSENTVNSDSSSSAVSSKAGDSSAVSSKASESSAPESSVSSGAVSEVKGEVYKGDGYSFTIPAGFVSASTDDENVAFSDGINLLSVEIMENKDGKTTLTQKDVEEQLAAEAEEEEISLGAAVSFKVDNFKNIKVDGKEAATFYCEMQMGNIKMSGYCAEIISGDKFIQFTLLAAEKDAKILDEVLNSVKIG